MFLPSNSKQYSKNPLFIIYPFICFKKVALKFLFGEAFSIRILFKTFTALSYDNLSLAIFLRNGIIFWNTFPFRAWLKKVSIFSIMFWSSERSKSIAFSSLQHSKTYVKNVPLKKSRFYFIFKHYPKLFIISKMEHWNYSVPRQYFLAKREWRLSVGFYLNFYLRY